MGIHPVRGNQGDMPLRIEDVRIALVDAVNHRLHFVHHGIDILPVLHYNERQ
ncbi:hypothetical protein D3C83_280300 [compost metagenome]